MRRSQMQLLSHFSAAVDAAAAATWPDNVPLPLCVDVTPSPSWIDDGITAALGFGHGPHLERFLVSHTVLVFADAQVASTADALALLEANPLARCATRVVFTARRSLLDDTRALHRSGLHCFVVQSAAQAEAEATRKAEADALRARKARLEKRRDEVATVPPPPSDTDAFGGRAPHMAAGGPLSLRLKDGTTVRGTIQAAWPRDAGETSGPVVVHVTHGHSGHARVLADPATGRVLPPRKEKGGAAARRRSTQRRGADDDDPVRRTRAAVARLRRANAAKPSPVAGGPCMDALVGLANAATPTAATDSPHVAANDDGGPNESLLDDVAPQDATRAVDGTFGLTLLGATVAFGAARRFLRAVVAAFPDAVAGVAGCRPLMMALARRDAGAALELVASAVTAALSQRRGARAHAVVAARTSPTGHGPTLATLELLLCHVPLPLLGATDAGGNTVLHYAREILPQQWNGAALA